MRIIVVTLSILPLLFCAKDYYEEIKKNCDTKKAIEYFERFRDKSDPAIFKVIDAMADCNNEEMERFLAREYPGSTERIKEQIFDRLTKNRSKVFLDIVLGVLINKIQTNQDYNREFVFIKEVEPLFIENKYNEYISKLKEAKINKNVIAIEVYSENIAALSKILGKSDDDIKIRDEVRSIKLETKRDDLYKKFVDATMNQEMRRAYEIFKKMKGESFIKNNEKRKKLEEILSQLSDTEENFYLIAHKQDSLMIEIEKEKQAGNIDRVKRLEEELKLVKSDMVLKKRALDRASKKLELVRELFEEVRIK